MSNDPFSLEAHKKVREAFPAPSAVYIINGLRHDVAMLKTVTTILFIGWILGGTALFYLNHTMGEHVDAQLAFNRKLLKILSLNRSADSEKGGLTPSLTEPQAVRLERAFSSALRDQIQFTSPEKVSVRVDHEPSPDEHSGTRYHYFDLLGRTVYVFTRRDATHPEGPSTLSGSADGAYIEKVTDALVDTLVGKLTSLRRVERSDGGPDSPMRPTINDQPRTGRLHYWIEKFAVMHPSRPIDGRVANSIRKGEGL